MPIESNRTLTLNPDEPFPMASTYKIAMAIKLLQHIEKGDFALDQMIGLAPEDLSPGSGMITPHFPHPGLSLSIYNLLEPMITLSDNTATDKVLSLIDGPKAVTEWLQNNGIEGMCIDRSTKTLLCDALNIPEPTDKWSLPDFQEQWKNTSNDVQKDAAKNFLKDTRDSSTPGAMVTLLKKLHRHEFLSAENTSLLTDIMIRCQTGRERIRGLLPQGPIVAHKTGSIRRIAVNDAGFINMRNDAGHIALAIFTKSAKDKDFIKVADCEHAIAHISRTVYDYFLFAQ